MSPDIYKFDVELVIKGCPSPEDSPRILRIIGKWMARGAHKFLFTLETHRFEECLDGLRGVLQEFLPISFTVREGFEPEAEVRVARVYLLIDNGVRVEKEVVRGG